LSGSLELPSSYLLGVYLTKCSGYSCLEFLPGGVCALPFVYRWFDPCPGIASTPGTGIVDSLNIIVELVCLAVELQLALCNECPELRSFAIVELRVLYLQVAGWHRVWLQLL
jgi:hypothetical protein